MRLFKSHQEYDFNSFLITQKIVLRVVSQREQRTEHNWSQDRKILVLRGPIGRPAIAVLWSLTGTKYWNRLSFANQILNLIKQNHLIQSLVAGYVENQRGFVQLVFPSLDRCHQFLQNFQIRNGIEIYFTNSALTGDSKMEELIQKYNLQSEFLGTFMKFFY